MGFLSWLVKLYLHDKKCNLSLRLKTSKTILIGSYLKSFRYATQRTGEAVEES